MRLLTITLFCASAISADAEQFFDGARLKDLCASNPAAVEAYVAAWHDKREVDGLFASMTLDEAPAKEMLVAIDEGSCIPASTTLKQLTDATCKFLLANERQQLHKANGLVAQAVRAEFPCK